MLVKSVQQVKEGGERETERGERGRGQGHLHTQVESAGRGGSKTLTRWIHNDLHQQETPLCVFLLSPLRLSHQRSHFTPVVRSLFWDLDTSGAASQD